MPLYWFGTNLSLDKIYSQVWFLVSSIIFKDGRFMYFNKCLVLVSHEKGTMGILVDIALEDRSNLKGHLRSNASAYMLPNM